VYCHGHAQADDRAPVPFWEAADLPALRATRRFALGAVIVSQLAVQHRYQSGGALRRGLRGLKPFLCAG
jgi:hypothetical protein